MKSFLILILLILSGSLITIKAFDIVRIFGHLDWAEKYLGPAGSYVAWRVIGIILIAGAIYGINVGWY